MVRGNGVSSRASERHQTALRGLVPSTPVEATVTPKRDAPETSPFRSGGHSKRTARPQWVTVGRWRFGGGIETPDRRCSGSHRVGSVLTQLARRATRPTTPRSHGATRRRLSPRDGSRPSSRPTGHRSGGQSKRDGVGRGPQRDGRGRASQDRRASAVAVVPQFGGQLPGPGRWSHITVRSCLFFSPGVWVLVLRHVSPSENASGRRPAASATGDTRPVRSWPPARSTPCVCRASPPAAAPRT